MNIVSVEVAELLGSHRDALPYRERAYGPAWMTWELISTPPARQHLVDWLAKAEPPPWKPLEIDDIIAPLRYTYYGDVFVHNILFAVLAKLPLPVAQYALANVTWSGIGTALLGVCGPPPDFGDRCWRIEISAPRAVNGKFPPTAGVEYLIAHEIGHAWSMEPPESGTSCFSRAALAFIYNEPLSGIEQGGGAAAVSTARHLRRNYAKRETVADRLAKQWGFPDVDGVGVSTSPTCW